MADTYMIDKKGQLFRKGEQIGKVEDGAIVLNKDAKNYVAAVTRWYNSLDEEPEIEDEPKAEITKPLSPKEQEEADLRGVAEEGREEALKAKKDWRDDVAYGEKIGHPVPKKNPQFGDKTPAYVEWLHKYRPDKFNAKFVNKGKGKIPVFKRNPETGVDEFEGYKDADFTLRKTHMTEKAETNSAMDESHDWDA